MVHTRMSAIGWVVGGSDTVVRAVLDAVGPDGTVMAYAGWEENPGRIPERIRSWPGAARSPHPEANMVAVGPRAGWLCSEHDGYDASDTPLSKLVEAEGQVLMLGAPLGTLTLLHHAEAVADVANKRRVTYRMPVLEEGEKIWRTFEDIETSDPGAFRYAEVMGDEDPFEVIAREALTAGCGVIGHVGDAESYLFEARPLVDFAVGWLEARFGSSGR
jgi:aminoglycoside 3-N-acetyltransferase